MEDFDLLYMLKTPFFLGSFDKIQNEASLIEINEDDQRNMALKNLMVVRALTSRGDFTELKGFMQGLFSDSNQKGEVANFSLLV